MIHNVYCIFNDAISPVHLYCVSLFSVHRHYFIIFFSVILHVFPEFISFSKPVATVVVDIKHAVLWADCLQHYGILHYVLLWMQVRLSVDVFLFTTGITIVSLHPPIFLCNYSSRGCRADAALQKNPFCLAGRKRGTREDFSRPQYLWNSYFQKHHGVYPYIFHCACSERQWELFMWSKKRRR